MSEQSDRYTVTALVRFYEHETRHPLGTAPSRRKARRIGYLDGCRYYPLLSTVAGSRPENVVSRPARVV